MKIINFYKISKCRATPALILEGVRNPVFANQTYVVGYMGLVGIKKQINSVHCDMDFRAYGFIPGITTLRRVVSTHRRFAKMPTPGSPDVV